MISKQGRLLHYMQDLSIGFTYTKNSAILTVIQCTLTTFTNFYNTKIQFVQTFITFIILIL